MYANDARAADVRACTVKEDFSGIYRSRMSDLITMLFIGNGSILYFVVRRRRSRPLSR